jgi:DNA-binding transcriptional MerR regulator
MNTADGRYVAVTMAGQVTGIPERTLRRWVADGKLPAIAGQRGRLVALADVQRLAALTGRDSATAGHAVMLAGHSANVAETLPAIPAEQLVVLRDEWQAPLLERIAELEQRIQQLESIRSPLTSRADANDAGPTAAQNDAQRPARLAWTWPWKRGRPESDGKSSLSPSVAIKP